MNAKIFRSSFFSTVIVLITTIAMILGILFDYFEKQIQKELISEADYISHAIKNEGLDYFDGFKSDKRVTVVDFNGNVVYDNKTDIEDMDNHSDREEIRDAMKNGTGESVRYSDTLSKKTVYYAIKLDKFILRVSTTQYTVIAILMNITQPMLVVLALAIILCLVLSARVSRSIIKPINDLDLNNPDANEVYEELTPLLQKVSEQKQTIEIQLEEAKKQNDNREALRREFTANVSHELKTPLTSISGFAELMKDGNTPPETVADFSTSIYNEAQRLIVLVNDIIKVSELDEGKIATEKEMVDLYTLSSDIIERLAPIADKRNITMSLIGDTAYVYGVKKIIDEMICNLCDNAIKYNKDNGCVDVIINTAGRAVSLTVRDTGIGIPVSEQQRVFERFYRVDKSHSKKIGGTGLGLAIVKHGAMCHNAEVSLDSVEGKGTSITIKFPEI